MSDQINDEYTKNEDKNSAQKTTQDAENNVASNAKENSDQQDGQDLNKGFRKPRGIGFLGRRGTAPIRTGNDPKQDEAAENANKEQANKAEDKDAKGAKEPKAVPLGPADKAFTFLSNYPAISWLVLILLLLSYGASSVWLPSVFFEPELHLMQVYSDMQGMGQWLMPPATEHIKTAFPVFYWFMALVDLLPVNDTIFLPLVSLFTAILALSSVYILGLCAGVGKRASFAAALLMLISPGFTVLSHALSPELFTAALFTFSLALLCRGWRSEFAMLSFIFGFLFLALASLSAGSLPLWTAIISSILFIFWRGTFGRANQLDAVLGFGVFVLIFAAWLVVIIVGGGPQASSLNQLMQNIIAPFMPPYWPLKPTWYYGLLVLALGVMPWILLPIFSSWLQVLKNSFSNLKSSRKENAGIAWLYICLVVGCIFLVRSAETLPAIILYPILMVLLAKTLCNLSSLGSNVFFALVAIFALVFGFICIGLSIEATASFLLKYAPDQWASILQSAKGLDIIGGLLLLVAIVLLKLTKRDAPCGALLVLSIFMLLIVQPFTMLLAPSLVGKTAHYHSFGSGMGILPYGLGAPAPVVVPLEEGPHPAPTPTVDFDAPSPAIPLNTAPNPSSEPSLPVPTMPSEPNAVEPITEAIPEEQGTLEQVNPPPPMDSEPSNSVAPDSLVPDSLVPDSVVPDSAPQDSVPAVQELAPANSL